MNFQKKRVGLVLGTGLVLAAFRTVILTYNMEKNIYENDTYYLPDNFIVNAFSVITVAFLLFFGAMAFATGRKKRFELEQKVTSVSTASCLLAFVIIGAVIVYVFSCVSSKELPSNVGLIILVFSVLSAVSFLITGLRQCNKKTLALTALFPIFLSVFRLLGDFIRTSSAPLASSGTYHITGLAALLIYFLCEGKSHIKEGSAAIYFAAGYSSVILLLVYSVPDLIMHCFGMFVFDYYAAFSVMDIAAVVYICTRMSNIKCISKKSDLAEELNSSKA